MPALATASTAPSRLVDLGAQLEAAWTAENSALNDMDEDTFEELVESTDDIAREIAATKAARFDDLRVKGPALLWCYDGNREELDDEPFNPSSNTVRVGTLTTAELLVQSIVRDLTGDLPASAAT
jgi:hypothetical protein